MQMERLCEDELMCIQQYAPMTKIGVSNERLYNEIKLLDPTFSMIELYTSLICWECSLRENAMLHSLHEVLREYHVYHAYDEADGLTFRVSARESEIIGDILTRMGYTIDIESPNYYSDVIGITIVGIHVSDPWDRLLDIERSTLRNPIRNIQFRHCHLYFRDGYNVYRESTTAYIPRLPEEAYNHSRYEGIRSIDPTIDMNMLYNVYMHKYARENAVRDMYRLWHPHLGNIEEIRTSLPGDPMELLCRGDTDLGDLLEEVPGWVYDPIYTVYRYEGPNVETMYERIQTMLRMYYSYSIPHLRHMGIGYYSI